jgi:hypothetical protein
MGEHKIAEKQQTVAPRTPLKKVELSRNSQANRLAGRNPDFEYRSFSLEPDHPDYIGKRLKQHEIGDQSSGYAVVDAWEVCSDVINEKVSLLDARTDQGSKVDTTVRYGRQITCRLPKSEYAKYDAVDRAKVAARAKQLYGSPDRLNFGDAVVTTMNSDSDNESQAAMGLLARAGHPMPGSAPAA